MNCNSCSNTTPINYGISNEIKCSPCSSGISSSENPIHKFISGQVSLVKSFWGFGILGLLIMAALIIILSVIIDHPASDSIFSLIFSIYTFTVSIGIWHSATVYTGKRVWEILSKMTVIFIITSSIYMFS
jgi:hypothetical protein